MFQETNPVRPYELRAQNAKALLRRLYRDVSSLVAQEVELAKTEGLQRVAVATAATRTIALSIAFGLLALVCLTTSAIVALANVVPLWLTTLAIGIVYVVAALLLRSLAWKTLARAVEPFLSKLSTLMPSTDTGRMTFGQRQARLEWTRRQVAQTMAALEQKTDLLSPMRDTALGLGSLGVALGAIVRAGDGAPTR